MQTNDIIKCAELKYGILWMQKFTFILIYSQKSIVNDAYLANEV